MEQEEKKTTLEKHAEKAAFSGELSRGKMHPTTMWDLMKMYLYRLYHTKMVYIVYGIVALIAVILVLIMAETNAQSTKQNSGVYTPVFSLSQVALWCYSVPALSITSLYGSFMTSTQGAVMSGASTYVPLGFVGLMVICFFVGKDWRNRTFRNQILAGHGRFQIYLTAQLCGLLVALGLVLTWEATIWALGSAFRIPAFLTGQFNVTIDGVNYMPDPAGVFCMSFFMELLIYISLTVLACAWAFIIPNSWGAFGLLYATIEAASLFAAVLYVLGEFNGNSYFQVQEWLMSYQLGQYNAFMSDYYVNYVKGSYGWTPTLFEGRQLYLGLKTAASSLIIIGGMGYLGAFSFGKRDLK